MIQFLGFTLFLVIVGGLAIHAEVAFPSFAAWFGKLPGDLIIKKDSITIYLPITSSALISAAFSLLFSFFSKK